jgi:hypothetical protein
LLAKGGAYGGFWGHGVKLLSDILIFRVFVTYDP